MQLRLRLDPQARAVSVGANQADAALQWRVTAELEGDDRGIVAGDVIAPVGFGGPGFALVETLETGGFEALGQGRGGMERSRGGLEEVDQALIQRFAHK